MPDRFFIRRYQEDWAIFAQFGKEEKILNTGDLDYIRKQFQLYVKHRHELQKAIQVVA